MIQSIILDRFKMNTELTDPKAMKIYVGDIIQNRITGDKGIVLTDAYKRQERLDDELYYHIYYFDKDIFGFEAHGEDFLLKV